MTDNLRKGASGSHPGAPRDNEYGPLGRGKDPVKDPMKGLRGMLNGVLIMEGISILLALLVVLKVEEGAYWTTFNWVFITVLGLAHFVMCGFQAKPWAMAVNVALQVIGLFGFAIHWSVGAVVLIFALVWAFMFHLRSSLVARMERGLLTTQHLGTD